MYGYTCYVLNNFYIHTYMCVFVYICVDQHSTRDRNGFPPPPEDELTLTEAEISNARALVASGLHSTAPTENTPGGGVGPAATEGDEGIVATTAGNFTQLVSPETSGSAAARYMLVREQSVPVQAVQTFATSPDGEQMLPDDFVARAADKTSARGPFAEVRLGSFFSYIHGTWRQWEGSGIPCHMSTTLQSPPEVVQLLKIKIKDNASDFGIFKN